MLLYNVILQQTHLHAMKNGIYGQTQLEVFALILAQLQIHQFLQLQHY